MYKNTWDKASKTNEHIKKKLDNLKQQRELQKRD